ncbi:MAG: transposase [Gemmatimonadota bacterium]|nr:MAG: transposase [Gemmatimonadota bacterium]
MRKPPNKKAWRKLHLAVDAGTGDIVASDLTTRRTHDCTRVPTLLGHFDNRVTSRDSLTVPRGPS